VVRVALYLRVSTGDGAQTTENQRRELETWAATQGHRVVHVFEDFGVSGAKRRDQRPQFDAMLKAATRREFDMLACWSIDRMGRSLAELVTTLEELHALEIQMHFAKQHIDTRTPLGRMMFSLVGAFAEFERSLIRERVLSGLARARAQGKRLGRPRLPISVRNRVRELFRSGLSQVRISREVGVSRRAVQNEIARIKATA
jgi:DNA invertase Pin-like site-specific DNA recombinase